jgi:hypothetical protein
LLRGIEIPGNATALRGVTLAFAMSPICEKPGIDQSLSIHFEISLAHLLRY